MTQIEIFLRELEQEALTTRKMLALVPADKFTWKPHPKSMEMRNLAVHIAELTAWVGMVLNTTELDFASNPYVQEPVKSNPDLLNYFEKNLSDGRQQLHEAIDAQLLDMWTLRNGEVIYDHSSKGEVIRMCFSQIIHHRAQLGVYLRLLNIPIPGSYGPSADELEMVASNAM